MSFIVGLTPVTREWRAISEFRFQEFVAPDVVYGLAAKQLRSPLKIVRQRALKFFTAIFTW